MSSVKNKLWERERKWQRRKEAVMLCWGVTLGLREGVGFNKLTRVRLIRAAHVAYSLGQRFD